MLNTAQRRALLKAAREGDLERLASEATGAVSLPVPLRREMLHEAAAHGHLSVVQYCAGGGRRSTAVRFDTDLDLDCRDEHLRTPLYLAAAAGHMLVCSWLLEHGSRVDARKRGDWTSLMIAACHGHVQVVRLLLDHKPQGANIHLVNREGSNAVALAAREGQVGALDALFYGLSVASRAELVNAPSNQGKTALGRAAFCGRDEVVKQLFVACGEGELLDIMVRDKGGNTVLIDAIAGGHPNTARSLLELCASKHQRLSLLQGVDDAGQSLLHHAVITGPLELVQSVLDLLREYDDADFVLMWMLNVRDCLGRTPRDMAEQRRARHLAEALSAIVAQ
ncbi:Ankyrin repeat domain-containing protein 16 [Porphyridium purpureum]|uniref:Ankyrin repeat domain-containing protein 16 n=1 Tax=Porphyridium purpureum TaxID=35688 RepID=A0A5J4YJY6_PORPP|nr:Ankyrin repeat domain-containing protein 16 [Porphyridium purpureum]|eukprot:POR4931..scf244_11